MQAASNVNQLNRTSARFCGGDRRGTHKINAVHIFVLLDELIYVPMFHPLGDHRKPAFTYRHSKQWQDTLMPEVLPGDSLLTEPLQPIHPYRCHDTRRRLTLKMTSGSSLRLTRMTLMATLRPLYVPRNTLAKPPRVASTAPFEQSGTCMDFGMTRC
jgi:hypothetical protein